MPARLRTGLFLLGVLLLAACVDRLSPGKPAEPTLATHTSPARDTSTASPPPIETTTALPTPAAGEPAPLPPTLSPSPTVQAVPAAPISVLNAASLTSTIAIHYSPWELVLALAWSPDSHTLAVSAGDEIHLYQAPQFEQTLTITPGAWSAALSFSPDGSLLASASKDGVIAVWRSLTGELLHAQLAHKKGANAIAFSPDGLLLASGGNDAIARLWDAASGDPRGQMIGGTHSVPALAFDPLEPSLAIANGNVVRWREQDTQRILRTLRAENSIYTLAFSPGGDLLALGNSTGQVQVWDFSAEELLFTVDHNPGATGTAALVWKVAFSPDGALLVSAAGDGYLQLWQMPDGAHLQSLSAHALAASSATFSPDGRWLASGGLDGVVRLWASLP